MAASINDVAELSIVSSKFLARRRFRPIQAKVRSTTHRLGSNPKGTVALKFVKKAAQRHSRPKTIVTDGLRSYGAALKALGARDLQGQ